MPGKHQTAEVEHKRPAQRKTEATAVEKTTEGAAVSGSWFAGLAAASGDGAVDQRIDWLANTDVQRHQRVGLASQIGRVQGNQHLQMLLASLRHDGHAAHGHSDNGHGWPATGGHSAGRPANGATDGYGLLDDELSEFLGIGGVGGVPALAEAEPPPHGPGNHAAPIAAAGLQRQTEAGSAAEPVAEDTPTEEEKAAALAKAKAAQAQATQTVGETKAEIAESRTEATAEQDVLSSDEAIPGRAPEAAESSADGDLRPAEASAAGEQLTAQPPMAAAESAEPGAPPDRLSVALSLEMAGTPGSLEGTDQGTEPRAGSAGEVPTVPPEEPTAEAGARAEPEATQPGKMPDAIQAQLSAIQVLVAEDQAAAVSEVQAATQSDDARMPSLFEMLGPVEAEPAGTVQMAVEGAETGGTGMQTYDEAASRAQVASTIGELSAGSNVQQQRIASQASAVRAELTTTAATLRQSGQARGEASVAALCAAFGARRTSLDTALKQARDEADIQLARYKKQARDAGVAAKGKILTQFNGHHAAMASTIEKRVREAEALQGKHVKSVHERTLRQAAQAQKHGTVKAATYPKTERGAVQAHAVLTVAHDVAKEIQEREPDTVDAVKDITEAIPKEFRKKGQKALDSLAEPPPELLEGVDKQVLSVMADLDKRAGLVKKELDTFAEGMRRHLDGLEAATIARARAAATEFQTQIDGGLATILGQFDAATPKASEQVQQVCDEAASILGSQESPSRAASQAFGEQVLGLATSIADSVGSGLEQCRSQAVAGFQGIADAQGESAAAIDQLTTDDLQVVDKTIDGLLSSVPGVCEQAFGPVISSFKELFGQVESKIREQLDGVVETLDKEYGQALATADTKVTEAVDKGLAKNDEALTQLPTRLDKAASDAAWDYDHPVLARIGAVLAGIGVGLLALWVVVKVIGLAIGGLVTLLGGGLLALCVVIALAVAALGYLVYLVYQAYQERKQSEGKGGWATFGKALLDVTGITALGEAIFAPGVTPGQRFWRAASGSFLLGGTVTFFYSGWRLFATGGLRQAWQGLRGLFRRPVPGGKPVIGGPKTVPEAAPEISPTKPVTPEEVPTTTKPVPEEGPTTPTKPVTTEEVPPTEQAPTRERGPVPAEEVPGGLGKTIVSTGRQVSGRFPDRAGPGEILYRTDPTTGRIAFYQVYDANGFPLKRVDLVGASHGGIRTPHVQPFTRGRINPDTGLPFVNKGHVRPALPEEIP